MFVTVQFPVEAAYQSTDRWFLDPADDWTVAQLMADVLYSARLTGYHLERPSGAVGPGQALQVLQKNSRLTLMAD